LESCGWRTGCDTVSAPSTEGADGVVTMATPAQFAASTARSYALVGFIFYLLAAIAWGIGLLAVAITMPLWIGQAPWSGGVWFPIVFPLGVFAAAGFAFAWWSWTALKRIDAGRYMDARAACLLLGVFGLLFAFLIGGVFFLLAHAKLGEALQPLPAVAPASFRVCTSCGRALAVDARFCAYCGKGLPA